MTSLMDLAGRCYNFLLLFFYSLLQYIWEQLYNTKSARDVGTLYNIRQRFGLVNVSSKVKNNFESANSLMLSTTKAYLCSAFMEYAGLERLDGNPKNITSLEPKDLEKVIGGFVDEYVMVEFDVESLATAKRAGSAADEHSSCTQTLPAINATRYMERI